MTNIIKIAFNDFLSVRINKLNRLLGCHERLSLWLSGEKQNALPIPAIFVDPLIENP